MRINSFIALIFLMLCNSSAWSQSPDLTFNTVSGTTNADGSELITTVLYEYSDGTSFVVDLPHHTFGCFYAGRWLRRSCK